MNKLLVSILMAALCAATSSAEYTTNDWAAAQAQWKAARVAWTNEMAKAAAAGLVPPRTARKHGVKGVKELPGTGGMGTGGMLQNVRGLKTDALSKKQVAYFKSRRICVKRDTTTMPGYVITTWHRNGKLDTLAPAVITNQLKQIIGKEQHNPIQERAEAAEAEAKPLRDLKKAVKRTSKNYDKIMKDLEKAKKKAADADELAFYEQLGEIITEAFNAEAR